MKSVLIILLSVSVLVSCASSTPPKVATPASNSTAQSFFVNASSLTVDRPYLLAAQKVQGDDKFSLAISSYVSHILEYQGFNEALVDDPEALYITYDFGTSALSDKQTCLGLTAFSKRVYDATKKVVPIWIADSCHANNAHTNDELLPMYALSLRDVVGKNASPYQQFRQYEMNDGVIEKLIKEVEPTIKMLSN